MPGEIRGLEYIHKNYGSLPWADIMAPAITLARDGFEVREDLYKYIQDPEYAFLRDDPSWAIDFAPSGELLKLGDVMTRKRYAATLQAIADKGADVFYTGPIAEATIEALQAANGTMTLEDLKNYTVLTRDPISIDYRGHRLTSHNAPSGGVVGLAALNTVSGYEGFFETANVNVSTHRLDEALRFAYGQRAELGDPAFVDGLEEFTKNMIAPATGEEIRSKISDTKTEGIEYYNPKGLESLETPGTSHIVSMDSDGLAVSLTTTVNLIFGSTLMVPKTGVVMNNQMNDFSIPDTVNAFGYLPSPSNFVRPGKRPLSSMTPIIAETPEGQLYYVIGAAGGSRIITSTVQNVINVLDRGLNVEDALATPRLHDQLSPDRVTFEWAYDNSTVAYMKDLGHNVTWVKPGQSSAQGARVVNGIFEAAGEPRMKNSGGSVV